MKVLCLLRRHKWRVDNSDPERPFEVCDRCGHYRNDGHWTDQTAQANVRPMPFSGGDGGGGIGGGGIGGGYGGGGA